MLHSDASVITHLKFKPDSKNWFVVYSISIFTDCVFPCSRFLNFGLCCLSFHFYVLRFPFEGFDFYIWISIALVSLGQICMCNLSF